MIEKHSYEQVHLKVEPKSFLYEFLNSEDLLYIFNTSRKQNLNFFIFLINSNQTFISHIYMYRAVGQCAILSILIILNDLL